MKYYLFIILFVCCSSFAKDFGIQGHIFSIIEENILEVIEKHLAKVDLNKLNAELRDKTEKYIETPPRVEGITKTKENKVIYFDPSYTVADDIYNHLGILITEKGTRINPLEHIALSQPLVFIDGNDEEQVTYAISIHNAKIILVKGSPLKLQRKHKRWIYFDQAGVITTKLGITEVPALVEQEGLKLRITVGQPKSLLSHNCEPSKTIQKNDTIDCCAPLAVSAGGRQ